MSAPRLDTKLDLTSAEAKARAAHNRALAESLRADVATAAKGGNEKSRERHVSRGKLLPRDRVDTLLDGGTAGQARHRGHGRSLGRRPCRCRGTR